jgi:hypothetical protein
VGPLVEPVQVDEALAPHMARPVVPNVGDTFYAYGKQTYDCAGYLKAGRYGHKAGGYGAVLYNGALGELRKCSKEEAEYVYTSTSVTPIPIDKIETIWPKPKKIDRHYNFESKNMNEAMEPSVLKNVPPPLGATIGFTAEGHVVAEIVGPVIGYLRNGTFCDKDAAQSFLVLNTSVDRVQIFFVIDNALKAVGHSELVDRAQLKALAKEWEGKPANPQNLRNYGKSVTRNPLTEEVNSNTYGNFPQELPTANDILDYMLEWAGSNIDQELVEEYFRGAHAILKMVPIDDLHEGDENANIRNPELEDVYASLDTPMPPLVVVNSQVIDGNHRLRVAKRKGMMLVPCYVVKWDTED